MCIFINLCGFDQSLTVHHFVVTDLKVSFFMLQWLSLLIIHFSPDCHNYKTKSTLSASEYQYLCLSV